jgi:hypothetical protein
MGFKSIFFGGKDEIEWLSERKDCRWERAERL